MLACLAGCLSVFFTCLFKSCAPHSAARSKVLTVCAFFVRRTVRRVVFVPCC
jgi:hypothetical protein